MPTPGISVGATAAIGCWERTPKKERLEYESQSSRQEVLHCRADPIKSSVPESNTVTIKDPERGWFPGTFIFAWNNQCQGSWWVVKNRDIGEAGLSLASCATHTQRHTQDNPLPFANPLFFLPPSLSYPKISCCPLSPHHLGTPPSKSVLDSKPFQMSYCPHIKTYLSRDAFPHYSP